MKSGLEGRNNALVWVAERQTNSRLNEVRPRRPEQLMVPITLIRAFMVSMKSGLEGRNNCMLLLARKSRSRLNEVRPRRPEQSPQSSVGRCREAGLNEVRPRRPEQYMCRHL